MILTVVALCCGSAATQNGEEKAARDLAGFETEWLTANLNGDGRWLERLITGKQSVRPASTDAVKQRASLAKELLNADVPGVPMKVRITGTVGFLTNDPAKNRSFNFLDTFNLKGGKWEVIASSFSGTGPPAAGSNENVEAEIRRLEQLAAKAILEKDEAAAARFFTTDSVTNDPRNGLTRGNSGVVHAMRTGLINYFSFDRVIESVQVLGETVVTMGNETVVVKSSSGGAGETIKRRFTNVWTETGQGWQIVARHASIIPAT